jgi:DNA-binding protein HU-beta
MTKKDLIVKVSEASGVKKADVERVVDSLGDVAAAELLGGGEVPFPGLGKLVVEPTKARIGRNPKNGDPVQIPAGRKAKFKVAKELKDGLKG